MEKDEKKLTEDELLSHLEMADRVNGKLIRLMESVIVAWRQCDKDVTNASLMVAAMDEMETAFEERLRD